MLWRAAEPISKLCQAFALMPGDTIYLLNKLRLGMSVFLDGPVRDAQKLLEEKAGFRDLARTYAANHIGRQHDNTAQSIETSALHLDLPACLDRPHLGYCLRGASKIGIASSRAAADLRLCNPRLHEA